MGSIPIGSFFLLVVVCESRRHSEEHNRVGSGTTGRAGFQENTCLWVCVSVYTICELED